MILGSHLLHEKITTTKLIHLLNGFSGVIIALSPNIGFLWNNGTLLFFIVVISWSFGNVFIKLIQCKQPFSLAIWATALGFLPFVGLSLLFESPETIKKVVISLKFSQICVVIYSGLIVAVIAPYLWIKVLERNSSHRVTPFTFLEPIIAMILGYVFLQESLSTEAIFGL
jgi:O-acetylserine/cysteine efflux transporter